MAFKNPTITSWFSLLIILFFTAWHMQAQETGSVKGLEDSISENLYSNPNKSIAFLRQYIDIHKRDKNVENLILANSTMAVAYEVKYEIDSSLFYYYKNLDLAQKPLDVLRTKYNIASLLEREGRNKEALLIYEEVLRLANENDVSDTAEAVKMSILSIENKILNSTESIEALEADYAQKKKNNDSFLRFTRLALIEAYIRGENYRKALVMIEVGKSEAQEKEDCEFLYYMNNLSAKIHISLHDIDIAEKEADKALRCASQLDNKVFIGDVNLVIAEIQFKRKNYRNALEHLKTISSNDIKKSKALLAQYYKLLADTYKSLDSTQQASNYYLSYIKERENLSESKFSALEILHDFNLKNEVSSITEDYENRMSFEISQKEQNKKVIWYVVTIGVILILVLIFYFRGKSKKDQENFDALLVKIKTYEAKLAEATKHKEKEVRPSLEVASTPIEDEKPVEKEVKDTKTFEIDDEKVAEILSKLEKLEEKLFFLKQDCTLHNVAKKLKTNTSYLSKIINTRLDKTFSTYINELRINYAILELKNNKRLRSYSVQGIATEIGYKNADAFTRYFKAATGISPSVYIQKINTLEESK